MKINSPLAGGLAALVATSALGLTGCSEVPDTVFLYFINGYPASAGVTLIGPTGVIAEDVQFGDRMGANGPCPTDASCIPLEFDRKFGSEFTILMDGVPDSIEASIDLYALYPQETGTLVLNRRSGEASADFTMVRHVQTISQECAITFINALSLGDDFTAVVKYYVAPEFHFPQIVSAGYVPNESELPFLTRCGPLPTGTPEHNALSRQSTIDAVADDPWFFYTPCADNAAILCPAWGAPRPDGSRPSKTQPDGTAFLVPNTDEYYECISNAITILPPPEMQASPFPIPEESIECPDGELLWENVQVDQKAAALCAEAQLRQITKVDPGAETFTLFQYFGDDGLCDVEFRVRSGGLDGIFGPEGNDDLGFHQNGDFVVTEAEIDVGSEHFWLLFGRPVNPLVWQWDSGDNFVNLESYPYPNGQNGRIGDYDHEDF